MKVGLPNIYIEFFFAEMRFYKLEDIEINQNYDLRF